MNIIFCYIGSFLIIYLADVKKNDYLIKAVTILLT